MEDAKAALEAAESKAAEAEAVMQQYSYPMIHFTTGVSIALKTAPELPGEAPMPDKYCLETILTEHSRDKAPNLAPTPTPTPNPQPLLPPPHPLDDPWHMVHSPGAVRCGGRGRR